MPNAQRRAVFLDRDGVINDALVVNGKPFSPMNLAELRILPGVPEACAQLKKAGFLLIVVTNQPDIANAKTTAARVDELNQAVKKATGVDDIFVCPHNDAANCDCRKPKPGLLLQAARRWDIDLANSFMVGDRWRDVEAGRSVGCRTVFIDYGYKEPRPERPDMVTTSLAAITPDIIKISEGLR
jgi:D-glycero-D-manno-heptose 1,7-bisphosphate phosphatase